MRQRWIGLLFALWAIIMPVVAVAASVQPAAAAGEAYSFQDANTIVGSGGDFGDSLTFVKTSDSYRSEAGTARWMIANITQSETTDYTATLTGTSPEIAPRSITITDPNHVGPKPAVLGASAAPAPAQKDQVACNAGNGGFTWFICGIIFHGINYIDLIRDSVIVPFLKVDYISLNPSCPTNTPTADPQCKYAQVYEFWKTSRNIASVAFIFIFMIVIFGTAIGYDSYTIKKVLPRLVAAAVLMPLSWYLCVIMIDVGNVLGAGIISLSSSIIQGQITIDFTTPFATYLYSAGGALLGLSGAFALAQLTSAVVVTAGLGLSVIFCILVWRQAAIVMFIIIVPFMILCMILPNLLKWWNWWLRSFTKLLFVYPAAVGSFEVGRATAVMADSLSGQYPNIVPLIQIILLSVVPAAGLMAALRGGGTAMTAGEKIFKRAAGEVDKRWGKDSDRGKAQEQNRRNRYTRLSSDLSRLGNDRSRLNPARWALKGAGKAAGMRAGIPAGFGYGRAGKLNRIKAKDEAIKELAAIKSDKQTEQNQRDVSMYKRVAQKADAMTIANAADQGKSDAQSEAIRGVGGIQQAASLTRSGTFNDARISAHQQMGQMQASTNLGSAPSGATIRGGARLMKETELASKYGELDDIPDHFQDVEDEIGTRNATGRSNRELRLSQARGRGNSNMRSSIIDQAAGNEAKFRTGAPSFHEGYTNALNKAALDTAAGDGEVIGNVEAMERKIAQTLGEARAQGTILSPAQARSQILAGAREAGIVNSRKSFLKARGDEEGAVNGHEQGVNEYISDQAESLGRTLSRDQATTEVLNAVGGAARINSSKAGAVDLTNATKTITGFQKAAVQAQADTLLENDLNARTAAVLAANPTMPHADAVELAKTQAGLTPEQALQQARSMPELAIGAGNPINPLTTAAGQRVIQESVRGIGNATEAATLRSYQSERKAAQADSERLNSDVRQRIEDDVEIAHREEIERNRASIEANVARDKANAAARNDQTFDENAARKQYEDAVAFDRNAARARIAPSHTSAARRQNARDARDDNLAYKAGREGEDKVNSEYSAAAAFKRGEDQAMQVLEDRQIDELTQGYIAAGETPTRAASQARAAVASIAGRAKTKQLLTDATNKSKVQEGARQAAGQRLQPVGQLESQEAAAEAAVDTVTQEDLIQRESTRLEYAYRASGTTKTDQEIRADAIANVKDGTAARAGIIPKQRTETAASAAIRVAAVAAQDQARKSQANAEAISIAGNTAARSAGRLSGQDLINVNVRSAQASQAAQEGALGARIEEAPRSYDELTAAFREDEKDKLRIDRIGRASNETMPINGVDTPINTLNVSGDTVDIIGAEAVKAWNEGNRDRAAALAIALSRSSRGRNFVRKQIAPLLGHTWNQAHSPDPEVGKYWQTIMQKGNFDKSPDLKTVALAAFNEFTPEDFSRMDWRTQQYALEGILDSANFADPNKTPAENAAEQKKWLNEVINSVHEGMKDKNIRKNFDTRARAELFEFFNTNRSNPIIAAAFAASKLDAPALGENNPWNILKEAYDSQNP